MTVERDVVAPSSGFVLSGGLTLVVVLLFAVSGGLLWMLGWNYEGLTGGAATKIHPSTYILVLLFAACALLSGNPVRFGVRAAAVRPGAALMLAAGLFLFATIVLRQGPGMAGVIDTFVAPALLMLLLAEADDRTMDRLAGVLHVLMTVNALLALAEFAADMHVFPYRFDGEAIPLERRSSALHGHPLVNAMVTATYVLGLVSGGRTLSDPVRFGLIVLQLAALVTFGGRTALAVTAILVGLWFAATAFRQLRSGRVSLLAVAAAALGLAVLPAILAGLAVGGFFDALLERFTNDGGSANTRLEMFALFDYLTWRDIVVGPDPDLVDSYRRIHGLALGIENPIVRMVLYNGAFVTAVMTVALILFMREIVRSAHAGVWLPVLAVVIMLLSAETIASKTTYLSKFAIIILVLYGRPGPAGLDRPWREH